MARSPTGIGANIPVSFHALAVTAELIKGILAARAGGWNLASRRTHFAARNRLCSACHRTRLSAECRLTVEFLSVYGALSGTIMLPAKRMPTNGIQRPSKPCARQAHILKPQCEHLPGPYVSIMKIRTAEASSTMPITSSSWSALAANGCVRRAMNRTN